MANLLTRFKKCGLWAGNGFWVGTQGAETQIITAAGVVTPPSISTSGTTATANLTVSGVAAFSGTITGPGAGANTAAGTYNIRVSVPIASVNAGYTLLNAVAGLKYRLVNVALIAIGGNLTSTDLTHLEVRGTQSASSAVLFKVAKAQLTQSSVNQVGTASTIVLADGASFVNNDVNTAITLNPLGGTDGATATNIDVILTYAVEA